MEQHNRAERERAIYNKGFDEERIKYSAAFGHANGCGYYADGHSKVLYEIMKSAKGKKVLELGASCWKSFLDLENYAPSSITCINISEVELEKGKIYPPPSSTSFQFLIMDANKLEFSDESFDVVIGDAILHHLDFETAAKEVHRVLKDNGFCLLSEPMGCNPVGKIVRKLTPEARTSDEKPLGKNEINILDKYFHTEYVFYQLFSVPAGVVSKKLFSSPYNFLMKMAYKIDVCLEKHMPLKFRMLYRHVLIHGKKNLT